MSLSLTGGLYQGALFVTPQGESVTRPTSGKVRQALFNILRGRFEDETFLDLYAGSGSVGMEAFSRGSKQVTLVEKHPIAYQALSENRKQLVSRGADERSVHIIREESLTYCKKASHSGLKFRIAFADPPFSQDFSPIWAAIQPLLELEGVGIVQFPTRTPPVFTQNATRVYRYGESSLAVFDTMHF